MKNVKVIVVQLVILCNYIVIHSITVYYIWLNIVAVVYFFNDTAVVS